MTPSPSDHAKLDAEMSRLKNEGSAFAMATVVRTVNATSAKPGGKALLDSQGKILIGWVGGGCARGAVGKAAREAIATGEPQFISLRPQELLETEGVTPGETRDGVHYARNGCPSQGTMDVFVEPVLPLPELVICGSGLVARALADLAARFDYKVSLHVDSAGEADIDTREGFDFDTKGFVVVATQGQGDLKALRAAVSQPRAFISFVGSRRKFATLADKLKEEDKEMASKLEAVKAPAGLDINAITPTEIAMSILAEITPVRRADRQGEPNETG